MCSRDSHEPDDVKFAHEVAAGIIARAHSKLNVAFQGSLKSDRVLTSAAKSASNFCSKLEAVSSFLQSPSSSIEPELRPAMERVQYKITELKNKAQMQEKQSASAKTPNSPAKKKNADKSASTFCLDERELRRLAIAELTKVPVKVVEKRLHGLGDRLIRHLSPKRTSSPFNDGAVPEVSRSETAGSPIQHSAQNPTSSSPNSHASTAIIHRPKRQSDFQSPKWIGGGPIVCAVALLAIVFIRRTRNGSMLACALSSQAAVTIQRAYFLHFYRRFNQTRKKRTAFFLLVKALRKHVKRWRLRKKIRMIHFIRRFLVSIKLRRTFVEGVNQKLKMVTCKCCLCLSSFHHHSPVSSVLGGRRIIHYNYHNQTTTIFTNFLQHAPL